MTFEETRAVLRVIKASYPHSFNKMSVDDMKDFLAVWSDMFADDDPMLVMSAVKAYIKSNTSQFAPSVGQVAEYMHKLSTPKGIDADTAWNLVYKALCNSIYHAKDEFNKLPSEVQAGVGSAQQLKTWATMDTKEVQTVVMALFKKGYTGRIQEKKDYEKLPNQAKALISKVTESLKIGNDEID